MLGCLVILLLLCCFVLIICGHVICLCFCLFLLVWLCLLFCFQIVKNIVCFPCNSSVYSVVLVRRLSCYLTCVFVIAFLLCCLLPLKMKLECFVCVCVVFFIFKHKIGLLSCLDLVVYLFFILDFCFFNPIKKLDTAKTPKTKKAEKHPNGFSVSAVVFTNDVPNFLGVG